MAPKSPIPARPMSTFQVVSLAASFVVALASGTTYVFSAYSPQLGARLKISYTQLNILGLAGNAGVYFSGLLWGMVAESEGLRILFARSFIFLLGGYSGIRYFYDSGIPPQATTLSDLSFGILVFCSFLAGCGGGGGFASTVNSMVKSFPDRERGSTTGLITSAFVLSAFFFSTVSNIFFVRDTSAFLLFLSLGTSIPMIMGFFLVPPIPLTDESASQWDNYRLGNNSRSHLLDPISTEGEEDSHHNSVHNGAVYMTVNISERSENYGGQESGPSAVTDSALLRNLQNRKVWRNGDFWLLVAILSLLNGTGLTYMNNVGSISQFLYAHGNRNYNDVQACKWQTAQVSTISFMNFSGRLLIGSISDLVKNKYDMPRSYLITLVASLLLLSQIVAANVNNISHLWIASSLLGLAHGSTASLFPTVCLEWFGMSTFSESWGYISASPMLAGSIISFIFGKSVDLRNRSISISPPNCSKGLNCYVDATHFTIGAGVLAVLLSIWAGYKDRQRHI